MKQNKLKKVMKLRKGDGGSNVALIALAIGVIIIIGMYIFTSVIGKNTNTATQGVNTTLESVEETDFKLVSDVPKNP